MNDADRRIVEVMLAILNPQGEMRSDLFQTEVLKQLQSGFFSSDNIRYLHLCKNNPFEEVRNKDKFVVVRFRQLITDPFELLVDKVSGRRTVQFKNGPIAATTNV